MSELFDREAFVGKVREIFAPMEALLPEGDAFDYDEVAFFTGTPNYSQEHVVLLPLTQASVSFYKGEHLGEETSWVDAGPIPFGGIYILPPTDCIHTLEPETPYLIRGIAWNIAEVVDVHGNVARMFKTWWHRGDPEPEFFKFSGNVVWHVMFCGFTTTNQR